jgi:cytochrome P450
MASAPGINQWLPLPCGAVAAFMRDPLGFQLEARARYGDVFRLRLGPFLAHFLYHPDHVRRVLSEHQKNYLRGWQYRFMRRLFGQNLTTSEGPFWLRQRRMAQPAFHRQRLPGYAHVMVDVASSLAARWRDAADERRPLEARQEMGRVAVAITSRTLFDRDISGDADDMGQAFGMLGRYFDATLERPFSMPPLWVPTRLNRLFNGAVATLNRKMAELVRERLREGGDHGDLLSMFIAARDEETGERMSEDQLRSEALNFMLAGTETTSTALTWTWYLLGMHGDARDRVRDEVRRVVGDRLPTAADAPGLAFTRNVILESMRLYPPVWIVPRRVVATDEVGGFRVPAGSTVLVSPYVTHRHPGFWEAPETFDPDRFTPQRSVGRPKEAYFPFLSGPHQCIGNEFSMLAMQLVVARVLQEVDVSIEPGLSVTPAASLGLVPDGPVRLTVERLG